MRYRIQTTDIAAIALGTPRGLSLARCCKEGWSPILCILQLCVSRLCVDIADGPVSGGKNSGASQPHKHIQFLPVEDDGPPIERLARAAMIETPGMPP